MELQVTTSKSPYKSYTCCQHFVFQDSRLPHSSHNLLRTAVDFFILLRHFIIVWQGTIKPRPIHKIIVLHLNYKARATTLPMDNYLAGWLQGRESNPRPFGYEPNELPLLPPCDMYTRHCVRVLFNRQI